MPTAEAIRDHIREMLVVAIETKGDNYHDERWRMGIEGAILEGRIDVLDEILQWIGNGKAN